LTIDKTKKEWKNRKRGGGGVERRGEERID